MGQIGPPQARAVYDRAAVSIATRASRAPHRAGRARRVSPPLRRGHATLIEIGPDPGQIGFPLGRRARVFGEALRFITVIRRALSVFKWVGLRRVDFRGGRGVEDGSSS